MKLCPTCGAEYADDQKFCPRDGTALRSTAQGGLVDSIIADRYHIEKKLGEGGMGAVYLGEHVKMGRKSAIKVMSPAMAADPDAIARFNREAANAARINHPNVCQIYDFGETADGTIYLAMELIEGESLGDVLEREGRLPMPRAIAILEQTADALQAAHDLGIVHRDLKPDNIMLARGRGGAETVKVVDFGIAKAMSGEEGQQVTKTGLVVGTPEYMSPEQLSGDKLDGRSDIYALALVFFRCLTGTFPFQAESTQEMMIKRLTDDPLPLNVAEPGASYPNALQRVLDRALARMPADRYASAVQFAADAAAAARGMPAQPTAGVAEAATQLLSAGAAATTLPPTQVRTSEKRPLPGAAPRTPTTPQPPPSPPRPARRRAPVLAIAAAVLVVGGGATAYLMLRGGGGRSDAGPAAADTSRLLEQPAIQQPGASPIAPSAADTVAAQHPGSTVATRGEPVSPNTSPAVPPARPVMDSAALDAEVLGLLDQLGTARESSAVSRALDISRDGQVPLNLRAEAAALAATVIVKQDQQRACALWRQARAWMPANRRYAEALNTAGCGS
jgi:serine/threonine protein kinase